MAKWKIEYTLNVTRIYDDNDGSNGIKPGITNPLEWVTTTNQWYQSPEHQTDFEVNSIVQLEPTNPDNFCGECGDHLKYHSRGKCWKYGDPIGCHCTADYTIYCISCKHEAGFHKYGSCHTYDRRSKDGRILRCRCKVESV